MKDHEYMNLLVTTVGRKKQKLRHQIQKLQREIGFLTHVYNEMKVSLEDTLKYQNESEEHLQRSRIKLNCNILAVGSIVVITYFYSSFICSFVITTQETIDFITVNLLIMQLLFVLLYYKFVYV